MDTVSYAKDHSCEQNKREMLLSELTVNKYNEYTSDADKCWEEKQCPEGQELATYSRILPPWESGDKAQKHPPGRGKSKCQSPEAGHVLRVCTEPQGSHRKVNKE